MAAATCVNNLPVGLTRQIKLVLIVPPSQTKTHDLVLSEGRKASKSKLSILTLDSDIPHTSTYLILFRRGEL